jgi:HPt (histidine-containing phosphotransfer) domain-containing protein
MPESCKDIFNWKAALERIGGDKELFEDYVKICLRDIPARLKKIRAGLSSKDYKSVNIHAHSIKGMANIMGAYFLRDAALAMETAGKSRDTARIRHLASETEREFERFRSVFERM